MVKYLPQPLAKASSLQSTLVQKVALRKHSDFALEEKKEMHREEPQKPKGIVFGVYNKKTSTFYYIDIHQYLLLRRQVKGARNLGNKGQGQEQTFSASHADQSSESKGSEIFEESTESN